MTNAHVSSTPLSPTHPQGPERQHERPLRRAGLDRPADSIDDDGGNSEEEEVDHPEGRVLIRLKTDRRTRRNLRIEA